MTMEEVTVVQTPDIALQTRGFGKTLLERVKSVATWIVAHAALILASAYMLLVFTAALFPKALTRYDPYATAPADMLQAPSSAHLFGTDELGRDLFARVVFGARTTILASLLALSIAVVAGLIIGVIAGYYGGAIDAVAMRSVDVLLAIPGLLLAITIVTAIGFGTIPVSIAIGVGITPLFVRTTRAQVLRVSGRAFIQAARISGSSNLRIIVRHIVPNSLGPIAVLALLDFGGVIMAVATLSFLGFGAEPPAAEWGSLINDARSYLMTSPWLPLLPGFVVVGTVLSVMVIANAAKKRVKQ